MFKIMFSLLFLGGAISSAFSQQNAFLDPIDYKNDPKTTSIYIPPSRDINLGDINKDAKRLIVEIPLDPESSDEQKQTYIKYILEQLEIISKMEGVKFEILTIQVGEQIFLTREEVQAFGEDYDKMAELNMKKAWNTLGPTLEQLFPKAKIYGFNWGW